MGCDNCWFKARRGLKHNPCNMTDLGCHNHVAEHHGISPIDLTAMKAKGLLLGEVYREKIRVNVYDVEGERKSFFTMKYDFDDEQNLYVIHGEDSYSIKKEDLNFAQGKKAIWFEVIVA